MLDSERDIFPREQRSFKTRLQYINEIFSNTFDQEEILRSCITHKLKCSYEDYVRSLERSIKHLKEQSELRVLKCVSKDK